QTAGVIKAGKLQTTATNAKASVVR
ncbi:MAG: hypothetical protein JWQ51_905, partial [Tardiphaga sp.]|nr:hypothetical protein [Tardiphaga sp.]